MIITFVGKSKETSSPFRCYHLMELRFESNDECNERGEMLHKK